MAQTLTEELKEVVRLQNKKEEVVIAQAVEIGLHKLWVDAILSQYLNKKISRRKAIQLVGLDRVRLADEQKRIVDEDIVWGKNASHRK